MGFSDWFRRSSRPVDVDSAGELGRPFEDVLASELGSIRGRRAAAFRLGKEDTGKDAASTLEGQRGRALNMDLIGLSFSGGGIRSATFSLGILQGMASLRMVPRLDYLSTVSGGGYAGGWLAAWIWREGDVHNVQRQLDPNRVSESRATRPPLGEQVVDEEPEPIYHLRAYSRFMSPRVGVASPDTWTVLTILLRNFLINLLILLPATLLAVLAARLVVRAFAWGSLAGAPWGRSRAFDACKLASALLAIGCAVKAYATVARERQRFAKVAREDEKAGDPGDPGEIGPGGFLWGIIVPLAASTVFALWSFALDPGRPSTSTRLPYYETINHWLKVWGVPPFLAMAVAFGVPLTLLYSYFSGVFRRASPDRNASSSGLDLGRGLWLTSCALTTGVLCGVLFQVALERFVWNFNKQPVAIATFGPPVLLLIFNLAAYAEVALAGRHMGEYEREWRSRLGAYTLIFGLAWLAFFGTTLYLPTLAGQGGRLRPLVTWALGTSWVTGTIGGLFAAQSPKTGAGAKAPSPALEWLAALGPPIFLAGLIAVTSLLAAWLVAPGSGVTSLATASTTPAATIAAWMCVFAILLAIFSYRVDVNLFSLHGMYENRLTRAYLGASRRKPSWARRRSGTNRWGPGVGGAPTSAKDQVRKENLVTGFDPADDIPLSSFRMVSDPATGTIGADAYRGPYPLFNTALNLVAGGELAWQDRKAESFVLTPEFCGSRGTGYAAMNPSSKEPSNRNMTLGRAMAISGAAADPNMGWHQSATQTALMTVFNARLGWWLQHPKQQGWSAAPPENGSLLLLEELRGNTNVGGKYVHLSDGGHFENLGVYELIRRRCRYIIACDPGEDRHDASENLANLVRLCRTDFGVRIEIDTTPIRETGDDGLTRWHCAVGLIRYDEVDPGAVAGTLVFIRSSLTGDEPPDVRNYADQNPAFPHESTTLDQLFGEAQFESYRMLGYHIAREVFGDASQALSDEQGGTHDTYRDDNRAFFARVRRRWFPPPPDFEPSFQEAAKGAIDLEAALRDDADLDRFSEDLYPEFREFPLAVGSTSQEIANDTALRSRRRAELHAVNQMLKLMEMAWLGVRLDGYYAHPMNRGWMNAFCRWTNSETFHKHWPVLRGGFSKDFVRFCEKALNLAPVPVKISRLDALDPLERDTVAATLNREFVREWSGDLEDFLGRQRTLRGTIEVRDMEGYLLEMIGMAGADAWLLTSGEMGKPPAYEGPWNDGDYPTGLVLVRPLREPEGDICPLRVGDDEREFFVWVRGPYRTLNIGRDAVTYFLRKRKEGDPAWSGAVEGASSLVARYPGIGVGLGDRLQRALWMSFFHDFNFRRVVGAGDDDGRLVDLVLKLELNPS